MSNLLTTQDFGVTKHGEKVTLYRIENTAGCYVEILNYNCIVKSIFVTDNKSKLQNVCLGYNTLAEYEADTRNIGAIVNICPEKDANCKLTGTVWNTAETGENFVLFNRLSPDGQELSVRYMWVDYNRLVIDVNAKSNENTPASLTSNIHFNLDGEKTLAGCNFRVFADKVAETSNGQYTGKLLAAAEAGFDGESFRNIEAEGYTGILVSEGEKIRPFMELNSLTCGISLTSYGTAPALHVNLTHEPGTAVLQHQLAIFAGKAEPSSAEAQDCKELKQRIVYGLDKIY